MTIPQYKYANANSTFDDCTLYDSIDRLTSHTSCLPAFWLGFRRTMHLAAMSSRCAKDWRLKALQKRSPETKVGITGIITRKEEFSPAEMATLNISTWYLGYFSWRTGLSNPWVEPALTESRFPAPARQQWKLVVTCGWCGGKELFHSSNTAKVIPQVKALNSRWSFQVQTVQTANHDHVFEIAAPNPVFQYWWWSILNSLTSPKFSWFLAGQTCICSQNWRHAKMTSGPIIQ